MTIASSSINSNHVIICEDTGELTQIYKTGISLTILKRPQRLALEKAARELKLADPIIIRAEAKNASELLRNRLKGLLDDTQEHHKQLIEDLEHCLEVYNTLLVPTEVGIRLATLDRAMCPAFHVDRIGIRLVTTYCGPGSEYLSNQSINRNKLGYIGRNETLEESGLLKANACIQSVPAQAIALFKGEAWLENEGNGIVHRSPDVPFGKRLVLTLDASFDD